MDIDIDLQTAFDPSKIFPHSIRGVVVKEEKATPHPCGVYFQNMNKDPINGLASMSYEDAEALGFMKIDFLHLNVYNDFTSRDEIEQLIQVDPDWDLLLEKEIVKKLFQLGNSFDVVSKVKPRSIEELADVLAIIRPGKRDFLPLYLVNKETTRKILYSKTDEYYFKKSHAISYALVIVLQLHLLGT